MSMIGESMRKGDAVGKVTGKADYPGDINMPGQAYMKYYLLTARMPVSCASIPKRRLP